MLPHLLDNRLRDGAEVVSLTRQAIHVKWRRRERKRNSSRRVGESEKSWKKRDT
jgi:hypothetical protein